MPTRSDPRSFLPLPAYDLHILLALIDQPRHGYAILERITAQTDGDLRLGTSTIYAALKRMLAAGLIAETGRPAGATSDDERRRYYRATALGSDVARAAARDVERLHRLLRDVRLTGARHSRPSRP